MEESRSGEAQALADRMDTLDARLASVERRVRELSPDSPSALWTFPPIARISPQSSSHSRRHPCFRSPRRPCRPGASSWRTSSAAGCSGSPAASPCCWASRSSWPWRSAGAGSTSRRACCSRSSPRWPSRQGARCCTSAAGTRRRHSPWPAPASRGSSSRSAPRRSSTNWSPRRWRWPAHSPRGRWPRSCRCAGTRARSAAWASWARCWRPCSPAPARET